MQVPEMELLVGLGGNHSNPQSHLTSHILYLWPLFPHPPWQVYYFYTIWVIIFSKLLTASQVTHYHCILGSPRGCALPNCRRVSHTEEIFLPIFRFRSRFGTLRIQSYTFFQGLKEPWHILLGTVSWSRSHSSPSPVCHQPSGTVLRETVLEISVFLPWDEMRAWTSSELARNRVCLWDGLSIRASSSGVLGPLSCTLPIRMLSSLLLRSYH